MSNRMFQGVIHQMKDTIGRVIGVADEMGVVVACSELNQIDSIKDGVQTERMSNSQSFVRNGYTFKGFTNAKRNDFYVFVEGTDDMADKFSTLISISISEGFTSSVWKCAKYGRVVTCGSPSTISMP